MNENNIITCEDFGDFKYLGSSTDIHRFDTNGILVYDRICIRNISKEPTFESAKESLEAYLKKYGRAFRRKNFDTE